MADSKNIIPSIQVEKKKKLSYQQRTFNSRIKKINKLKEEEAILQQLIPEIKSKINEMIEPLDEAIVEVRAKTIELFDKSYDMPFFRKKEKEKLQELILQYAFDLIDTNGVERLIPIHDKHSEDSFEEIKQVSNDMTKSMAESMFKNMFNVDLDFSKVEDMNDFEAFGKTLYEQMDKIQEEKEEKKKKRKKTKAQVNKEERLKEEAKQISKTSKAIYTELVKEYHPDKEADEEKKEKKTELMKEITKAYNDDDFFALLNFQIQLKEGDLSHLDEIADDHLKYYNKILKEQMDELSMKVEALKNPFPPFEHFGPYLQNHKYYETMLEKDRRFLEQDLKQYENEYEEFSDKKKLRAFLKNLEAQQPMIDPEMLLNLGLFDDDDEEDDFSFFLVRLGLN